MYEIVKSPGRRVTQKWLDQAFAPVRDYLKREYPGEHEQMISYLMFMGNEEGKFHYKNSMTRSYIVLDQRGEVVSFDESAVQYEFDDWFGPRGEFKSLDEHPIHPNVARWIEGNLSKAEAINYGLTIKVFLQKLWGPLVNYDFSDLKVGFPLKRAKPAYSLYIYPSQFRKLVAFQFVGDEIVERRCTVKQYDDYLHRGNELTVAGWTGIIIIPETLERITNIEQKFPKILEHACTRVN